MKIVEYREHGYPMPNCKTCGCTIGVQEVRRSHEANYRKTLYCDKCRPAPRETINPTHKKKG